MALSRHSALQILGLSSSASKDDIKDAYRKLASKYHPDKNPGDETAATKMREINEAKDFLDKNTGKSQSKPWNPQDFEGFSDWDFGGKSKTRVNLTSLLPVSLSEAFLGTTKIANFEILGKTNFTIPIPKGIMHEERIKIITTKDFASDLEVDVDVRANISTGDWKVTWPAQPNLYGGGVEGSGDMEKTIHVDMFTMMNGGYFLFESIDGATLQLRIIAGMEAGTRLKVKDRGFWKDSSCTTRGNVYLKVLPIIRKMEDMEISELEELSKLINNTLIKKRDPFHNAEMKPTSTFA